VRRFSEVERTGIEPVTSGLQTHPIGRHRLTPTDRSGMTEPKSASVPDVARHGSTEICSHRARTDAAWIGNECGLADRSTATPADHPQCLPIVERQTRRGSSG
jgi:hypothetical protein